MTTRTNREANLANNPEHGPAGHDPAQAATGMPATAYDRELQVAVRELVHDLRDFPTGRVVFLVTGAEKAEAVAAAFGPHARPDPHVPVSMLPPLVGDLVVLLDRAAASRR